MEELTYTRAGDYLLPDLIPPEARFVVRNSCEPTHTAKNRRELVLQSAGLLI